LDWLAFRDRVGRAATACSSGDELAGCELYERALELWQGDPLADIDTVREQPAVTMVARAWATAISDYARAGIAVGSTERTPVVTRSQRRGVPSISLDAGCLGASRG